MTMDKTVLQELIYPLLKRAVNYYLHFVKKKEWEMAFAAYRLTGIW